jgi:hypothetical protein
MKRNSATGRVSTLVVALLTRPHGAHGQPAPRGAVVTVIAPDRMGRVGSIDARYQSYNIEMLEVTGGKFWKPHGPELDSILAVKQPTAPTQGNGDTPAGMNPGVQRGRIPVISLRTDHEFACCNVRTPPRL